MPRGRSRPWSGTTCGTTCRLRGSAAARRGHPYPQFIARAKGAHVWDPADTNSWTTRWDGGRACSGHADDRIQAGHRRRASHSPAGAVPRSDGDGRHADAARGFRRRDGALRQERIGRLHHRGAAGAPRHRTAADSLVRVPRLAGLLARTSGVRRHRHSGRRESRRSTSSDSTISPRSRPPSRRIAGILRPS